MRSRPRVRLAKSGLAFWLLVVTTSPAFSHDHADGDRPHTHGLGIFASSSSSSNDLVGNGLTPDTHHCHLVILGIEIHVPATCPWAADQDSRFPAEQVSLTLCTEMDHGLQAQACNPCEVAVPAALAPTLGAFLVRLANQRFVPDRVLQPLVCDLARGLRSGAQQI
jgi:hypothetical protein